MGNRPERTSREPAGTDAKTRTDDEHIHEEDKQLLHTQRGHLIPKKEENPALADLKEKRRQSAEEE
jgi:hypothetical protein